jgi:integrase
MKNGKDHRVPVPAYAAQILTAQKKTTGRSKFVFPSRIAGQAVSSQTVAKFLAKTPLRGRLVAHGLRSLARSWLADHAAPYEVAELCLAHTVGSQVSRAYQRSDMIEKRRQFMDAWSLFVSQCA